jgi:hypothetical protein
MIASTGPCGTKVVVLFGAGASAFSGPTLCKSGTLRCPPVGNGPNGLFATLASEHGIAARLDSELQAALRDDFESGMRLLERMPSTWHVAFQRQIALHLANYSVTEENYYVRLLAPSFMRLKNIQYSTINYDMLLDQALRNYGFSIEGSPIESPSCQDPCVHKRVSETDAVYQPAIV